MAFETGSGTISPGGTAFWNYSFAGADHGAQCAMANPKTPGVRLDSSTFGKELQPGGGITYFMLVSYGDGVDACNYDLQGGGFV